MENRITLGVGFAILGMSTHMVTFFLGVDSFFSTQLYFLYLLLAIYLGMRSYKRSQPEAGFRHLFKSGMQGGAIFTLLVSAFGFVYYKWINPEYFLHRIESRVAEATQLGYSAEDIEKVRSTAEFIFSSVVDGTVSLIMFMLMSVLYSLTITVLFRRIPALWKG
ncbi:DUF4199 domain-containing protein [bacterium SCSIO 12741]|nr:DUF4199 domain-containing protein [bacterium SCSIO 12741]